MARSRDLVNWETHPSGAEHGAIADPIANVGRYRAHWAPDVRRRGRGEWLFYGSLQFDDHCDNGPRGHGIVAARSSGPLGFAETVVLLRGPGFATIDPCFFRSRRLGRDYLYWGSGGAPILGRELRADGLGFAAGSTPQAILMPDPADPVRRLWEGVHVIERPGSDDLLFLVSGPCTWNGPYRTHVFLGGPDPLAPARPLPGRAALLAENAAWNRCGQVFVVADAIGQGWIVFHAVRGDAIIPGTEGIARTGGGRGIPLRQLCMERLFFDADGLPFVDGGSPSWTTRRGPVVSP